jgi:hypothetical protein
MEGKNQVDGTKRSSASVLVTSEKFNREEDLGKCTRNY